MAEDETPKKFNEEQLRKPRRAFGDKGTPFTDLVASTDRKTILLKGTGHVGLAIGGRAQKEVWPQACEWLAQRSAQRRTCGRLPGRRPELAWTGRFFAPCATAGGQLECSNVKERGSPVQLG